MLRSPTHAGGLFAMDRNYFLELGAYDPGLLIWGGENFELSFKVKFINYNSLFMFIVLYLNYLSATYIEIILLFL